ncbi:MAG: right-handed parallel beta-helix repeat-containing protein [Pirellulales bacterium]|nr:right-handed parallel beta-helix repeat-containing protein [Pirellulales bacterium]
MLRMGTHRPDNPRPFVLMDTSTKPRRCLMSLIGVSILVFCVGPALAAEQPRPGWLNVADFGASGSEYETTASTTAGSRQITVADPGDFQPGQGVTVVGGHVRHTAPQLWSGGPPYDNSKPLDGSVEVRGYDGARGRRVVYLLDIAPSSKPVFRWTDDLGRSWHETVEINHDWHPLGNGVEVKLNPRDWNKGYVISFAAENMLTTVIEKIDGTVVTLRDAPNRTSVKATLRHCDDRALCAAIETAIKRKRNVWIPAGRYRLDRRVMVRNPEGITIEGENAATTTFDISDGQGPCLVLSGGREVTVRNLRFVGFMGFDRRDQAGRIPTRGAEAIWGFFLDLCNGVTIGGTERVLVENCHASRMSGECFVSACPGRGIKPSRPQDESTADEDYSLVWKVNPHGGHTISTTYLRCSVTDSARNAFNDVTCGPENTNVIQCRIVDVGGCTWEGASRFIRFTGNYVRNAGTVAIGNLGVANRDASFDKLGAGQHVVAGNTFESSICYGGCAVRASAGATQVIVSNNHFVNFNSSGVEMLSQTGDQHFPSSNAAVLGNSFDMTSVGRKPAARHAIKISASDTIAADNQIYVRGRRDPALTGIIVLEPARNVIVHDNLIRNCVAGFVAGRLTSSIGQVIDQKTFIRGGHWLSIALPLVRDDSHGYRGWNIVWIKDERPDGASVIESFDRTTRRFTLREPREMRPGDRFEVYPPGGADWAIHDNVITNCLRPAVLDCYGSPTTVFQNNQLTRGDETGVEQAVEICGRWNLIGNRFFGFNEQGRAALSLHPDRQGNPPRNLYLNNVFERCRRVVRESQAGLWRAAVTKGNIFLDCGDVPPQNADSAAEPM